MASKLWMNKEIFEFYVILLDMEIFRNNGDILSWKMKDSLGKPNETFGTIHWQYKTLISALYIIDWRSSERNKWEKKEVLSGKFSAQALRPAVLCFFNSKGDGNHCRGWWEGDMPHSEGDVDRETYHSLKLHTPVQGIAVILKIGGDIRIWFRENSDFGTKSAIVSNLGQVVI